MYANKLTEMIECNDERIDDLAQKIIHMEETIEYMNRELCQLQCRLPEEDGCKDLCDAKLRLAGIGSTNIPILQSVVQYDNNGNVYNIVFSIQPFVLRYALYTCGPAAKSLRCPPRTPRDVEVGGSLLSDSLNGIAELVIPSGLRFSININPVIPIGSSLQIPITRMISTNFFLPPHMAPRDNISLLLYEFRSLDNIMEVDNASQPEFERIYLIIRKSGEVLFQLEVRFTSATIPPKTIINQENIYVKFRV